jgi:hypothetical protein
VKTQVYRLIPALLLVLLAGCGVLGIQAPTTFNERALAATATVNTASQTVLTLLQARKITPDESDRYTDRAEDAQEAINLARSIYASNPLDAENRLELTIQLLQMLTAELEKRK